MLLNFGLLKSNVAPAHPTAAELQGITIEIMQSKLGHYPWLAWSSSRRFRGPLGSYETDWEEFFF